VIQLARCFNTLLMIVLVVAVIFMQSQIIYVCQQQQPRQPHREMCIMPILDLAAFMIMAIAILLLTLMYEIRFPRRNPRRFVNDLYPLMVTGMMLYLACAGNSSPAAANSSDDDYLLERTVPLWMFLQCVCCLLAFLGYRCPANTRHRRRYRTFYQKAGGVSSMLLITAVCTTTAVRMFLQLCPYVANANSSNSSSTSSNDGGGCHRGSYVAELDLVVICAHFVAWMLRAMRITCQSLQIDGSRNRRHHHHRRRPATADTGDISGGSSDDEAEDENSLDIWSIWTELTPAFITMACYCALTPVVYSPTPPPTLLSSFSLLSVLVSTMCAIPIVVHLRDGAEVV